jgi:hypothetical protein
MDLASVVFPLADFDPESPHVDWRLRVDSRLVKDDAVPLDEYFEAHPVQAPRGRGAQAKYVADWRPVRGVDVRLEVWATALPHVPETYLAGEEQWWCKVEANPARLRDPAGWRLCPVEEAGPLVMALVVRLAELGVVERACSHLALAEREGTLEREHIPDWDGVCRDWACLNSRDACGLALNRLDVSVDVEDVEDIPLYRHVVRSTPQPHLKRKEDSHGDRYIAVSSGERGVRFTLYDKHEEARCKRKPLGARAPVGTMRLEAQVHKDWLANHGGVRRPEDINQRTASALFLRAFRWAGLERAVGRSPAARPRRLAGTGRTKTRNFRRWLEREAAGETDSVSKRTSRDFHELARQNGFVVGLHPDTRLGRPRRLDLVEAREVPVTDEWAEQHDYRPSRYRKRSGGCRVERARKPPEATAPASG